MRGQSLLFQNGSLKRGNENTAGEIDAKKFKGQDGDTFTTLPYRDIPYEDQVSPFSSVKIYIMY